MDFRQWTMDFRQWVIDNGNKKILSIVHSLLLLIPKKISTVYRPLSIVLILFFWFCLPKNLFNTPTSKVLEDKSGNLLGARIAKDGQWRFPDIEHVPEKYTQCLINFEDKYFYRHAGVNPFSLVRAVASNLKNKKVVSGGSTITMQVIRMSRQGSARNVWNKIIEAIQATRLEMTHSKSEILKLYASNAPYGGNVVGIEAASWRYFGKNPNQLSWAESATLAILPNAPTMIHLAKHREALLNKRNRLLKKLRTRGIIDKTTFELAQEEPLPEQPLPLPQFAPHLLDRIFSGQSVGATVAVAQYDGQLQDVQPNDGQPQGLPLRKLTSRVRTTIDIELQKRVIQTLQWHQNILLSNGIHNSAALVIEVETGNIVAYVGNTNAGKENGEDVDIIRAPRSTGSIMKPFLYALAQQEGEITPNAMLTDIPTDMGGYHPENFNETYDGVIPARRALARSLNIPFVRLLSQYGVEKFHHQLPRLGIHSFTKSAEHYGLTIILGGGESTLQELTNTYACMARTLSHWYKYQNKYDAHDWRKSSYQLSAISYQQKNNKSKTNRLISQAPVLNAASCWLTLDAMKEVERPQGEGSWELFDNTRTIAWKTGTSYGFRDAWAIGVTPKYVVGVWVGNADGEGRPGLIGIEAAAPILFDIFNLLPTQSEWFDPPYDDMVKTEVCKQSGFRATELCEKDTVWTTKNAIKVKSCPFHQIIHLDATGKFQVNSDCESPDKMIHKPWFILPPLEEYYFRIKNPLLQSPPPFRADCRLTENKMNPMQFIYPKSATKIFVPTDVDGQLSPIVFRMAHTHSEKKVFWHLDNTFVATTQNFHQLSLTPSVGKHKITLVDEDGARLEQSFEILPKVVTR